MIRVTMAEAQVRRIYGVDFSGAADAGRWIWIAAGAADGRTLRIEECFRGEDLPGAHRDRAGCHAALRDFVRTQRAGAFGFDFPFGLPAELVHAKTWEAFVTAFPLRHPDPQAFLAHCRKACGGRELKRATDRESRTPFSPYNLRVYRQTYFGIRDLLAPLVARRWACVLPMQRALPDKPWVLEICPASLLKEEGLYAPYKGHTPAHRSARRRILASFEGRGVLSPVGPDLRRTVLDDPNGDALDAVLAALAVFRAVRDPAIFSPPPNASYGLEGWVYPNKVSSRPKG